MDLNDSPEQAEYREKVRAWLEAHRQDAPAQGAGTSRTPTSTPGALAGRAGRGRPGRHHLAQGVRRPGARPDRAGHRQPGDRAGRRPGHPRRHRRRHARPDAHRPRHRRAEDALPRPDAPRRRGLVPALLRAGRRLGPRGGPDPRDAPGRRRRGGSTARRCGRRTPSSPPTGCCWRAPNPDVPKHKGLTMFVVPMDAEGVTVRGLRQISGEAEFNEVFFDDVQLAADAVVGGVDNGWVTALTDAHVRARDDRPGLGGPRLPGRPLRAAPWPTTPRAAADPDVRKRAGRDRAPSCWRIRFTGYRTLTALQRGQIPARRPAWPRSRRSTRRSRPAT